MPFLDHKLVEFESSEIRAQGREEEARSQFTSARWNLAEDDPQPTEAGCFRAVISRRVVAVKQSVLQLLVCLRCQGTLKAEAFQTEGREIMEGALGCSCGAQYPIISGVPRMLPGHLLPDLASDYPAFFTRHAGRLSLQEPVGSIASRVQRRTQESFGYEWTWASDFQGDGFPEWFPEGIHPEMVFRGHVGLEVGCGAGRHAEIAARLAKEHFAIDLSRAVDPAFERTRAMENCHVIQADTFHLPFKKGSFDYVYCLGVLQHLHDPKGGFRHLTNQPREGGALLVNVYQASRPVAQFLLELVRKVTTRLPNTVLRYLSIAAALVDYGLFVLPWKKVRRGWFGRALHRFVPQRIDEYARHDFDTCVTDWFDRLSCPVKLHFKREDLISWYQKAGYAEVIVTPYWKAFWNGYGRRIARFTP